MDARTEIAGIIKKPIIAKGYRGLAILEIHDNLSPA